MPSSAPEITSMGERKAQLLSGDLLQENDITCVCERDSVCEFAVLYMLVYV